MKMKSNVEEKIDMQTHLFSNFCPPGLSNQDDRDEKLNTQIYYLVAKFKIWTISSIFGCTLFILGKTHKHRKII